MADRRPIFDLHIRPMFRVVDHVHMLRLPVPKRIDLLDYQQVKDRHDEVSDFLKAGSPMPPGSLGGPWPQEWIDVFERWTKTGFGRLTRPTATNFLLAMTGPDRYTLSCTVSLPHAGANSWFEIIQARPDAQQYELVMEEIDGATASPSSVSVEERIRGPLTVASVGVLDGGGQHDLPVPTS